MDTLKEKIKSLKAMMYSFGITLNDIVDNDELLALLRLRLYNGKISKQDTLNIVNNLSENQFEQKPEVPLQPAVREMLKFATHGATGLLYALCDDKVIGPVIEANGLKFVLDLKNSTCNLTLDEAEKLTKQKGNIGGISWIVPGDNHFYAMQKIGAAKLNSFLEAYGGDTINATPFLSTTSQANQPKQWNVRLVLPLQK